MEAKRERERENLGNDNSDCEPNDKYHCRVDFAVHPEPGTSAMHKLDKYSLFFYFFFYKKSIPALFVQRLDHLTSVLSRPLLLIVDCCLHLLLEGIVNTTLPSLSLLMIRGTTKMMILTISMISALESPPSLALVSPDFTRSSSLMLLNSNFTCDNIHGDDQRRLTKKQTNDNTSLPDMLALFLLPSIG